MHTKICCYEVGSTSSVREVADITTVAIRYRDCYVAAVAAPHIFQGFSLTFQGRNSSMPPK